MIIGIGTDIIEVSRIEKTLSDFGDVFLEKYFSNEERLYAESKKTNKAQALASAWATKEAVGKALGTGISGDITLKSISLSRNQNGAPSVTLINGADRYAKSLTNGNSYKTFVSISHDGGMVNAFVVLEEANV